MLSLNLIQLSFCLILLIPIFSAQNFSNLTKLTHQILTQIINKQVNSSHNGYVIVFFDPQPQIDENKVYKIINEIIKASEGVSGLYIFSDDPLFKKMKSWLGITKLSLPSLLLITSQQQKYLYSEDEISKAGFYRFLKKVDNKRVKQVEVKQSKEKHRLPQLNEESFLKLIRENKEKVIRFYCSPEKPHSQILAQQFFKLSQILTASSKIALAEIDIVLNQNLLAKLQQNKFPDVRINQKQFKSAIRICKQMSSIFFWGTQSQIEPLRYDGQIDHEYIFVWLKNYSEFPYEFSSDL